MMESNGIQRREEIVSELSSIGKLVFFFANYFPLLLVGSCVAIAILVPVSLPARIGLALACLYLMPPLLARVVMLVFPFRDTHISTGSRQFVVWWILLCLQTLFLRFDFLEEGLRTIPSVYSMWLRLWGARVGKLTYWAPGTRILDRPFLRIGDSVVFGVGVCLSSHAIVKNEEGQRVLLLDDIHLGNNCLVGAFSLLSAGTRFADDECGTAYLRSPPFSHWKDNRRVRDRTE